MRLELGLRWWMTILRIVTRKQIDLVSQVLSLSRVLMKPISKAKKVMLKDFVNDPRIEHLRLGKSGLERIIKPELEMGTLPQNAQNIIGHSMRKKNPSKMQVALPKREGP